MTYFSEKNKLDAARRLFEYVGELLNVRFSVRLWDGTMVPLGKDVDSGFFVAINGPGVIGSLLRRPTYENLLLQYANGYVDIDGDLIDFMAVAREKRTKKRSGKINKLFLLKQALPLLLTSSQSTNAAHEYRDDEVGRKEARRDNKEFIQFHYDISNDFYSLFLGAEMQYSCGYFTARDNSLDQAQHDKLGRCQGRCRIS